MDACDNMMASMNDMMTKMNAMEMSPDTDHDFAHMMIEHHQGAIDGDVDKDLVMMMILHHESAVSMAEMEVATGRQDDIKQMAQQMKMDQEKEIKEMQMWLDNHK